MKKFLIILVVLAIVVASLLADLSQPREMNCGTKLALQYHLVVGEMAYEQVFVTPALLN